MIDVIWHGRGGQGAFTGARILGAAWCARDGRQALAFPSFGPERRGAPMRAFTKLGHDRIGDRSAPARADVVIYLDETLFDERAGSAELKPGGAIVLNTARELDLAGVACVDANGISRAVFGRPIPNTTLLGALPALIDGLTHDDLVAGIRACMAPKLHEGNIAAVQAVAARFKEVRR